MFSFPFKLIEACCRIVAHCSGFQFCFVSRLKSNCRHSLFWVSHECASPILLYSFKRINASISDCTYSAVYVIGDILTIVSSEKDAILAASLQTVMLLHIKRKNTGICGDTWSQQYPVLYFQMRWIAEASSSTGIHLLLLSVHMFIKYSTSSSWNSSVTIVMT